MTDCSPRVPNRGFVDQVTNYDDKENNPILLKNEIHDKEQEPYGHQRRRRCLSLVDSNTMSRRNIGVNKFVGVTSEKEMIVVSRNRWGSMVDSLKKYRKNSQCLKIQENVGEESDQGTNFGNMSIC